MTNVGIRVFWKYSIGLDVCVCEYRPECQWPSARLARHFISEIHFRRILSGKRSQDFAHGENLFSKHYDKTGGGESNYVSEATFGGRVRKKYIHLSVSVLSGQFSSWYVVLQRHLAYRVTKSKLKSRLCYFQQYDFGESAYLFIVIRKWAEYIFQCPLALREVWTPPSYNSLTGKCQF